MLPSPVHTSVVSVVELDSLSVESDSLSVESDSLSVESDSVPVVLCVPVVPVSPLSVAEVASPGLQARGAAARRRRVMWREPSR
jgi:hypothetical protein